MAGAAFVVTLVGDLDMGNLDQLGVAFQDFRRSTAADVRVVMTELTFMDSSVLSALLRLRAAAAERGGQVTLVDVPRVARRVLEVDHHERTLRDRAAETDPEAP